MLFIAGGTIFFLAFGEFDFQWSVLPELAPEDGFTVAPPPDDDFLPWPGIFTGAIWLGLRARSSLCATRLIERPPSCQRDARSSVRPNVLRAARTATDHLAGSVLGVPSTVLGG